MSANFARTLNSNVSIVSISFDGSNGVATSAIATSNGIYYSSNFGATWTQSNISTGDFFCCSISGTNAVAGNYSGLGIYYSTNSGQTWIKSTLQDSTGTTITGATTISFYSITLKGQYGIAGVASSSNTTLVGIYYTSDSGVTWRQSASFSNQPIYGVYLNNLNGIAVTGNTGGGIYYSSDRGVTWLKSSDFTGDRFNCLVSNGSTITLAGASTTQTAGNIGGIYLSTNLGINWTRVLSNVSINSISFSGTNAIAGSEAGIYYSSNSGANWTKSVSFTSLSYYTVYLYGTSGVAGGFNNSGIHISNNSGVTWSATNVTTNNFRSSYIVNDYGVMGSTSVGIYTSTNALCYNEDTEILCLVNGFEEYVKISNISVGDMVKTYKNDYKKVKYVKGFNFMLAKESNDINSLFKMKNTNLIVTGGHSILVDSLTDEQIKNNMKYNFNSMIEDKKMLLACSSEDFEKINSDNCIYKLYHLVLENDNEYQNYGIWVNQGILSETCSENAFKNCLLL